MADDRIALPLVAIEMRRPDILRAMRAAFRERDHVIKRQQMPWDGTMTEIASRVSSGDGVIIDRLSGSRCDLRSSLRRILSESQSVLLAPLLTLLIDVILRVTVATPDDRDRVFGFFAFHADRANALPVLLRPQPPLKRIAGCAVLSSRLLLGCAASTARLIQLRRMPRFRQIKACPTGQLSGFRGDLTASVADTSAQPCLPASFRIVKAGWAQRAMWSVIAKATSGAHAFSGHRSQRLIIAFPGAMI